MEFVMDWFLAGLIVSLIVTQLIAWKYWSEVTISRAQRSRIKTEVNELTQGYALSRIPKLPHNSRWFKQFKTQLRKQGAIDTQFRNALMTVKSNVGPLTYSIDGWITNRLAKLDKTALKLYLSEYIGSEVYDIEYHKSSTYRTTSWFRQRKRFGGQLNKWD